MACRIVENVVGASDGKRLVGRLGMPCGFVVLELKWMRKTKLENGLESGELPRDNDGLWVANAIIWMDMACRGCFGDVDVVGLLELEMGEEW